jgi:hypothetical protein
MEKRRDWCREDLDLKVSCEEKWLVAAWMHCPRNTWSPFLFFCLVVGWGGNDGLIFILCGEMTT